MVLCIIYDDDSIQAWNKGTTCAIYIKYVESDPKKWFYNKNKNLAIINCSKKV